MNARLISRRRFPTDMVTHLRTLAAERPRDTALIVVQQDGEAAIDKKIDYATLNECALALAAVLQRRFAIGERALLLLDNDEHYVISFFACLYAGLIAVPVFPPESVRERHLARLLAIAADAEARCILTTSELMPLIGNAAVDRFSFATVLAVDAHSGDASAWHERTPKNEDIAFLQYTSGSTSTPKGVMVSHGNLMVNARAFEEGMSISSDDIFVSWLPLYHDMGLIGGLSQPIHRGIPTVLMTPKFFIERPVRWLEAISRHRATISGAPNFAFQLCVERVRAAQLQDLDLSSWRVAFSGAEPVRRDTMSAFIERFTPVGLPTGALYPCYGLAEATLFVTGGMRGQGVEAFRFDTEMLAQGKAVVADQGTSMVACGFPASGHTVRIIDPETMTERPAGHIGEIWTDGPSLAGGYWRRSRETTEAFVSYEGGRWLRTGDLGFFHAGKLYIAGRLKDLIIIRGQNIYPQDIEQVIEEEVEAARKGRVAAFSVETEIGEGIGVAVEISRGMQKLIAVETLVTALSEAASASCREPLSVVVLLNPGALPKTSSGKLQRAACHQGWRERSLDAYAIYEYGRYVLGGVAQPKPSLKDESEIALASIWEKVLKRTGLGREDHFFTCGGNSLAAVQVAVRISDFWQIDFPVRSLFENPRLHECAAAIGRFVSAGAQGQGQGQGQRPGLGLHISPPGQRASTLPLSHGQQRLWFLWRMDPDSNAYHIKFALRLSGELNTGALQASFNGLVERHESLRTVFRPTPDGSAEQIIQPGLLLDIKEVDLCSAATSEHQARLAEYSNEIVAAPFDLAHGPLLRLALIRVAQNEHILVLAMHHIISDGASMQVLLDELAAQYRSRVRGEPLGLNDMPLQYADYATWQRKWLEAGEKDRQLEYWRGYLGNDHPILDLPTDHPRRQVANYRAARHIFDLPAHVVGGLRRLARDRAATLFMVLLAGFQALLFRHTGQQQIRVGVPIANRNRIETEAVIGFFVNTQVFHAEVDGRTTLTSLLDQVREAAIDAQANQDLPFDQLVEALQPERSLSRSPLFQVTINHLLRDDRALRQLPGIRTADYPLPEHAAQFELTLETVESAEGGVRASFIYASELFDPYTVERLGRHYVSILWLFAEHPEEAVGDISLLSDGDKLQLQRWGTKNSSPASALQLAHRLIERQAETFAESTAVIFGDQELSYGELNRRANRLAHRLIDGGVKPEVKVGIAIDRSIELIIGLLAILKAGGAYVPLDPEYPRERLNHMVEDSGIRFLLTRSNTKTQIPRLSSLKVLEFESIDLSRGIDTDPEIALHADNLAYVIYTSGSTGLPKGVAVAHGALVMHLQAITATYDVRPGDRELMFFSMNFDAAAEQWMTPLCGGGAIVLSAAQDLAGATFVKLMMTHGVTTLHLPPAYLRLLLPMMEGIRSSVRTCIAGGEAWYATDLAATRDAFPGARVVNAYGPTETVITPTAWVGDASTPLESDYAPIGGPVGARRLYVLDAELNVVPQGVVGELYVGGLGLARGYLNNPALTADRFVADPFGSDGGRLYRTGDLVRWRSDGHLEYMGRLDHQIKIRGFRVELGEIEAQLLAQTGVREAVVLTHEMRNGKTLLAYVAAHAGVLLTPSLLRASLCDALPDYMIPSQFVFLEALPLGPNGKINRKALPLPEQSGEQDYAPPVSAIEVIISEIWAEVLEVPRVGLHQNFFDLGGHSLLLIRVQSSLEKRLNAHIPIIELFKHTTVASLARLLGEETPAQLALQRHEERAQRQRGAFIQRKRKAGRSY